MSDKEYWDKVREHNVLYDDWSDYPHDGWAFCPCPLAVEIRANLPSRESTGVPLIQWSHSPPEISERRS